MNFAPVKVQMLKGELNGSDVLFQNIIGTLRGLFQALGSCGRAKKKKNRGRARGTAREDYFPFPSSPEASEERRRR